MRAAACCALISLCSVETAWAWGRDGHRIINCLAARYLPVDTPAFLRSGNALDTLAYLGPEPDRWRNRAENELSDTQAADHFIDLEYADLMAPLPRKRYDFIGALAAAHASHPEVPLTPEKMGLLPWQTEEVWQRLKVDFREYRKLVAANQNTAPVETAILFDAGWLGHYVADGSQPLHTSIQYNGWVGPNPEGYTTQHKIHSQFEGTFVSANIKTADIRPLIASSAPRVIDNEWQQFLDYLHHSSTLVETTYRLDKEGGFNGAGNTASKAFTEERLAAAAIELRDLIYSAWVHSADPVEEYKGP